MPEVITPNTPTRPNVRRLRPYGLAIVLGLAVAVVSMAFLAAVNELRKVLFDRLPDALGFTGWGWVVLVCSVGGLVVGAINLFSEGGRSNAHDLDESFHDARSTSLPTLPVLTGRIALGIVSLAFGAPLGPEAPLIVIVAALAARVSPVLRAARAEAVDVSVSAALGALFGSPLAVVMATEGVNADPANTGRLQRLEELGPPIAAGLAGLVLTTHVMPSGSFHPFRAAVGDVPVNVGGGLAWCALAALAAALLGRVLVEMLAPARMLMVTRVPGGPIARGVISGLVLGVAGAIAPLVLFSGHHETQELIDQVGQRTVLVLLGIALLKMAVVAITLAGGWFGGQVFPFAFIGAAAAASLVELTSTTHQLGLIAAGFSAGCAIAIRRPVAALLLLVVFFPTSAWAALAVGAVVAAAVLAWWPAPAPDKH